ncbi:MAG: zinc ribbon domain-containing protein [Vicinamibacterales bacterium]
MPLYEYACRSCGRHFEYLTRADQAPACPSCSSTELEKQFSAFAVNAGSSATPRFDGPAASPCGMCGDPRGPGACSMN